MKDDSTDELRARAAAARRIADEVRNPADGEALRKMAEELEEEAARLETGGVAAASEPKLCPRTWVDRASRRGVELPVFAYTNDDQRVPALMTDLSYDGCQLRVSGTIAQGQALTIVHAFVGEITGQIQWTEDDRIGVRFEAHSNGGESAT